MYKVDMLKVLTTVALLTVASAAPLMPGEPDAFEEPADGGKMGQNQHLAFPLHSVYAFDYFMHFNSSQIYLQCFTFTVSHYFPGK